MKSEWNLVRLGDIADVQSGGTPLVSNPDFWNGDVAWYSSGELNVKYTCTPDRYISQLGIDSSNAKLFPKGSLLIGMYDTAALKMSILDRDAAFNQAIAGVRPNTQIDLSFIQYAIDSHREYILGQRRGVRQKNLSLAKIRDIELWLPPLTEQQRIVAIIDEAFEAIAAARTNAEHNRQNARALFESYLQSVFSQRGNGWVEKTLGDIGKVSMCKRVLKEQTSAIGDIPFYKIGSFGKKADSFISTELYSKYKEKYSFPKKGDILLSAAGTIGRRVIFDGNDAYFQDSNIVWIANDQTQVLNCFLYHFYGACEWNATKGATILRLYNDDLRRIVIAFPTSLDVQKSIAAQMDLIFDATQRLESLYQRKIAALDELKQSLLQQAFSGQL